MLTSTEIEAMRTMQEAALPDTCTIKRRTLTSDGQGGYTESWSTVDTVNCRLSPATRLPEEIAQAGKLTGTTAWIVTLDHDADVTAEDRLEIGSKTLEVLAVLSGKTWETARRVICQEMR